MGASYHQVPGEQFSTKKLPLIHIFTGHEDRLDEYSSNVLRLAADHTFERNDSISNAGSHPPSKLWRRRLTKGSEERSRTGPL